MGLFRNIRASFARAKRVARLAKAELETAARYQNMTRQEAEELPDDLLWECVTFRLERQGGERLLKEPFGARQAAYTVAWFDREVQSGGLYQYFVNSSRESAPLLEDALTLMGAEAYRTLFHTFVTAHAIDVRDLSSFVTHDIDRHEEQTEQYPFDEFDDAYYDLYEKDPLERYGTAFVREHMAEFFDG